jgi:hypothetical protein
MRWVWFAVSLFIATPALAWHHPLAGDGGDYWRTRAIVEVSNSTDRPQTGVPVTLTVGTALPSLPLAGKEVKALRVCDEAGRELLFDLRTANGLPRRSGKVQVGDRFSFFASVPPKSVARFFVYADNPKAWVLPEVIRAGLSNGSFEVGEGDPADWERVDEDAAHHLAWVTGVARTGKRSVQTIVAEGAAPTWVKFHQPRIPLIPNATYRLRGFVKAQNVKGSAGWFIHVFGEKGKWLINRVLTAGDGTYDWRPVEFTFTVPENGRWATIGTVLYGTGTAWFDDVTLELLSGESSPLQVKVVGVETMMLIPRLQASSWLKDEAWQERVPLIVHHFDDRPTTALVYADLRKVLWRFSNWQRPPNLCIIDPEAPPSERIRPHWRVGNGVLFLANLPPRSLKRFDLYLSPTAPSKGEANYEALVSSPANLVPDPSFEERDDAGLPKGWRGDRREGVEAKLVAEGQVGKWAAQLRIAPQLTGQWLGWRCTVPVKPLRTYFYSGFVKAEGNQARLRLHLHWRNTQQQLTGESPFATTNPEVTGGQGWVQTSAFLESPADAAFAELHLTTNTAGTFWHDGIFFGEVLRAVVGGWERRDKMPEGLTVCFVNPLVRVFPDMPPRMGTGDQGRETDKLTDELTVVMARNEWEPVQVALWSDRPLRRVRVEVTPLTDERGQTLPPPQIWRVGYVPVDHPSGYFRSDLPFWFRHRPKGDGSSDGWAGEWADPLMPFAPFDLPPNRTEALWFVLYAPPDAEPGLYKGQIRIAAETANAKPQQATLSLSVQVVPLTLPQETELTAILDLRGLIVAQLRQDPQRLQKWYRFLAQFRISPGFVFPQPTFRYENGKVVMDAKGFDEMASFLLDELKVRTLYTPDFLYAFGWAYPPKRFFGLEPFTDDYNRAYQALLRAFFEHVQKRGWGDRFVYYLSDEPHFWHERIRQQMKRLCQLAHQAVAGIRIYASTWHFVPDWLGDLDIWGVGPHGSTSVADMERLKASGAQLWFTTDGHFCIDTPYLAMERLLPYLCFRYGVSGYEFWGVSWWTYDPWEFGWHAFISQSDEGERYYWIRYPNGDGYFVYPGERFGRDEPLPSIRLMQVREGIEDYLILRAVERMLTDGRWQGEKAERARRVLERAKSLVHIPNQGGLKSTALLPDPDEVLQVRQDALQLFAR